MNAHIREPIGGEYKALPHNIEAEQALLGSILLYPDVVGRVADILSGDDFLEPAHRLVFLAVLRGARRRPAN